MSELLTGNPERYLTETGEELMELWFSMLVGAMDQR